MNRSNKKAISVTDCRKILNGSERKYTDEQIVQIRDFLYLLAHLEVKEFIKRKSLKNTSEVSKSVLNG